MKYLTVQEYIEPLGGFCVGFLFVCLGFEFYLFISLFIQKARGRLFSNVPYVTKALVCSVSLHEK